MCRRTWNYSHAQKEWYFHLDWQINRLRMRYFTTVCNCSHRQFHVKNVSTLSRFFFFFSFFFLSFQSCLALLFSRWDLKLFSTNPGVSQIKFFINYTLGPILTSCPLLFVRRPERIKSLFCRNLRCAVNCASERLWQNDGLSGRRVVWVVAADGVVVVVGGW